MTAQPHPHSHQFTLPREPEEVSRTVMMQLLKPLVNAKLSRERDPNCRFGGYSCRRERIVWLT